LADDRRGKGRRMSDVRDTCCACGSTTLIFACSGSSNVGQLTNSLALRLAREGVGTMSCLAGVGAHLNGFVVPAKDCERLVVLDGCEHRCAWKTLEHVQARPRVYLNFTEHGFVKKHGVLADEAELGRAHAIVEALLGESACSTAS
jgi:uncharacterized metal-binding protein